MEKMMTSSLDISNFDKLNELVCRNNIIDIRETPNGLIVVGVRLHEEDGRYIFLGEGRTLAQALVIANYCAMTGNSYRINSPDSERKNDSILTKSLREGNPISIRLDNSKRFVADVIVNNQGYTLKFGDSFSTTLMEAENWLEHISDLNGEEKEEYDQMPSFFYLDSLLKNDFSPETREIRITNTNHGYSAKVLSSFNKDSYSTMASGRGSSILEALIIADYNYCSDFEIEHTIRDYRGLKPGYIYRIEDYIKNGQTLRMEKSDSGIVTHLEDHEIGEPWYSAQGENVPTSLLKMWKYLVGDPAKNLRKHRKIG